MFAIKQKDGSYILVQDRKQTGFFGCGAAGLLKFIRRISKRVWIVA